jgi:peptidoglycan-associated lipoprotein
MTRILIVLVAALAVTIGYTTPSDACGVKLTVKSPKVKKRVKRTSYPSHILVLGSPPSRRLSRWLNQAGHTVETTKNASGAERKDYAIVIADPEKMEEARQNFPRSRVVTRSGTLSSNVRKIERVLARAPGQGDTSTVVASRPPTKRSRRAGVSAPDQVRATREERPRAETRKPEPRVAAVDTAEPKESAVSKEPEEPAVDETDSADNSDEAPITRREPKPARKGKWTKEFYFGSNSTGLDSRSRSRLKANAQWLAASPDVSITIEGHTDSSGPAEYNKVLGERRAESVRDFLVEQGVDSSRIEVISYGEERPAYSSGRKNRRVLIVKN